LTLSWVKRRWKNWIHWINDMLDADFWWTRLKGEFQEMNKAPAWQNSNIRDIFSMEKWICSVSGKWAGKVGVCVCTPVNELCTAYWGSYSS
jgi:hypothetical protein